MQTPPQSPKSNSNSSLNMSERQSNGASEPSQAKAGASAATQRPGSSQSQRRTPQKLGPRKFSHQSQSGQSNTQTPSAHDVQQSGPDSAHSKPPTSTNGGSQPAANSQQHQQSSEQSAEGSRNQSRRRQARRRGRGRSATQTSESDTGSVSEVAQGGRRNRNRKKPSQSPQAKTQGAPDTPKGGGKPLDTLDEVGETADGVVESKKSTTTGVKKDPNDSTASKKKGKAKEGEGEGKKDSTLRLRIDLDLDLELELKAKIQGSVTLALLD